MSNINYGWKRVESPAVTPCLDLALVKQHLRLPTDVGFTEQDAVLTRYVNSAERLLEDQAEITLRQKTWQLWFSDLPCYYGHTVLQDILWYRTLNQVHLRLTRPPITAISWVKYYDSDNTLQTLDTAAYYLLEDASPPLLILKPTLLPDITQLSLDRLDRWRIEMVGGSDTESVQLDPTAEVAILLLTAYYYRHPEDDGRAPPTGTAADRAFKDCLENLRWRCYP